jgi:uncharacterized protein YegL
MPSIDQQLAEEYFAELRESEQESLRAIMNEKRLPDPLRETQRRVLLRWVSATASSEGTASHA